MKPPRPSAAFKTGAINRSATSPQFEHRTQAYRLTSRVTNLIVMPRLKLFNP
jgi:hypothetical protein